MSPDGVLQPENVMLQIIMACIPIIPKLHSFYNNMIKILNNKKYK